MRVVLLVLLGWYALVPPADRWDAPLGAWEHFKAFDTANDCERTLVPYVRDLPRNTPEAMAWYERVLRARCIDSADGRLR